MAGTKGPAFLRWVEPVVSTLNEMGGSAATADVIDRVIRRVGISEREQAATTSNGQSRVRNEINWARFYLTKFGHIDGSQRGVWTLTEQGRGAALDHEGVNALFRQVQRELARERPDDDDDDQGDAPDADLLPDAVARWREQLERARDDTAWVQKVARLELEREHARLGMRDLFERFMAGSIDIDRFRSEFDHKSRVEWATFGVGAMSGGMFLNMLVKHVENQGKLTQELHRVLALPVDADGAERQLRGFSAYLLALIESGAVTKSEVQPARATFFVPVWWHIQSPREWPIYYESARDALSAAGDFQKSKDKTFDYLRFRHVFLDLATNLNTSTWEFEQLCRWVVDHAEPVPSNAQVSVSQIAGAATRRVWLLAPGEKARLWDDFRKSSIAAIGWDDLGDLSAYTSVEALQNTLAERRGDGTVPRHDALACWEFAHAMQIGDLVFVKRGRTHIIGHGFVESDYMYDDSRPEYRNVRKVRWESAGSWRVRDKPLVTKTLTDIGEYPQLVEQIKDALGLQEESGSTDDSSQPVPRRKYDLSDACADLFVRQGAIERVVALLRHKKNIVLQGPPSVGKTFVARRLAYLLIGEVDPARVHIVQFHQSYGYEDFVRGYRPTDSGGFERKDGPFLRLCNDALQDRDNPYVMILDEINRGNLSKILGDLMMLIEPDKRDESWASMLSYSLDKEAPFYVPPNVHLIGTMNTADRSLALVDYALRRRFSFVKISPGFDTEAFSKYMDRIGVNPTLSDRIRTRVSRLNELISKDPQLGSGFCIGHSYFCRPPSDGVPGEDWFRQIVEGEIEPLLTEYWFDAPERAEDALVTLLDDA